MTTRIRTTTITIITMGKITARIITMVILTVSAGITTAR